MHQGRAAVVLVVVCAAAPPPAAAQSEQITGVVVDATGGVLPGATVTLRGGPDGLREAQTDASGRVVFTVVAPGTYAVTVFLAGFGAATVEGVAVSADPVELPAITLRLAAFDDVVVVTATRIEEPLQQVPLSISAVTGADLERRAIGNLTELSRWTPGLTVVDQGARGSNVCAGKARSRGTRCRDVIFETLFETLWVSNPIRPRSAASRNRVMRGPGVTQGAKRSQGARRPRN